MFWIFESSNFWIANCEKEDSTSDVSMYSLSWVSSQFLHECSFDLVGLSDIRTLRIFQWINYIFVCCDFVLCSVHETGKSVNSLCILHCIPIFSEASDECRICDQYLTYYIKVTLVITSNFICMTVQRTVISYNWTSYLDFIAATLGVTSYRWRDSSAWQSSGFTTSNFWTTQHCWFGSTLCALSPAPGIRWLVHITDISLWSF